MAGLTDVQNAIYLGGAAGTLPAVPIAPDALRDAAQHAIPPEAFDYLDGGAGGEHTMAANRAAFDRYGITQRMLTGLAERDLATSVVGQTMPYPVLAGPLGVLDIVHPDGESAVARACADLGMTMVLSTQSSTDLETIAAIGGPRWYQLYWPNVPDLADSLIGRAEAAGYTALVVTVDTPMLGWRPRDLGRAYLPFLAGRGIANYTSDPVFASLVPATETPEQAAMAAVQTFVSVFGTLALTYESLADLCARTRLPVIVKGIVHPDDALAAANAGAAGVIVSNHGGRQVDRARGALDCLPDVVAAVGGDFDVLFDSGIRSGADIAIALALGARAVLIGRPYGYGLAAAGQAGVTGVLSGLLAEFDATLALSGCGRPSDLVVTAR